MIYTFSTWLFFFYFYCFLGWVWETCYVSVLKAKWVNRGFMRGPFLPIYGSGAVVVLIFTLPFRTNAGLVFLVGMTSATLLEYFTGVAMEKLVQGFLTNKDAWVIVDKVSGKPIGYITVDIPYRPLGVGEVGYVIGARNQGQGYAFEAVCCILTEYFDNQGLYLVEAKCSEENLASLNLLEKVGFHVDGRLRDRRMNLLTGERNDMIVVSITQDEFKASYE